MRAPLLAFCCSACATATPPPNLPAGVEAWPTITKLAYFPIQVQIAVDGAPITPESLVKVQQSVQGATEGAVEQEDLGVRAFFALSEPWHLGAVALGQWLEATPCFGGSAPADARIPSLAASVRADAIVYLDLRAELSRDGIGSGHTVLGKLAGGAGVATLANLVALHAAADSSPLVELAVEATAAQLVARDLESHRYGPLCADHVDLELRDAAGVRVLGHAEITVAVIAADNRLLWFRRGRAPLLLGEPQRNAELLAELVRSGS